MSENGRKYVHNNELTVEYVRELFKVLERVGYQELEIKGYIFFIEAPNGCRIGCKSLVDARRYINKEKLRNFDKLNNFT